MWNACLFLDILEINFSITWIPKGQCKVKEEAILAFIYFLLKGFKSGKKYLSKTYSQMNNPFHATEGFKNIHLSSKYLLKLDHLPQNSSVAVIENCWSYVHNLQLFKMWKIKYLYK